MIATERSQETNLIPSRQQLSISFAAKSSYVCAYERLARKTECFKHRYAQGQIIPVTDITSDPHCCVTLDAGITRACNDERSVIRLQMFETFVCCASHQQGEDVAILRMRRVL